MEGVLSKEQRIVEAAELVFAKHGYENCTVDEIVTLADVGKGTLYKYFGNKEQLFYGLVSKKNAVFVEALREAVENANGFEAAMVAFFTEMIAFYKSNTALWQIIYFEMLGSHSGCMVESVNGVPTVTSRYSNTLPESVKEQMIRYHLLLEAELNILLELFKHAHEEGLIKGYNIEDMTKHVFFGVAMCIFHGGEEIAAKSPVDIAKEAVEFTLYGVVIR